MMVCGLTRLASTILSRIWPRRQPGADARRSGREVALEALLRKRPAVAEQAQADLPVEHDLLARDAGSPAAPVRGDGRLSLAAALPAAASSNGGWQQPIYTISMPWFFSGTSRKRLPVAR